MFTCKCFNLNDMGWIREFSSATDKLPFTWVCRLCEAKWQHGSLHDQAAASRWGQLLSAHSWTLWQTVSSWWGQLPYSPITGRSSMPPSSANYSHFPTSHDIMTLDLFAISFLLASSCSAMLAGKESGPLRGGIIVPTLTDQAMLQSPPQWPGTQVYCLLLHQDQGPLDGSVTSSKYSQAQFQRKWHHSDRILLPLFWMWKYFWCIIWLCGMIRLNPSFHSRWGMLISAPANSVEWFLYQHRVRHGWAHQHKILEEKIWASRIKNSKSSNLKYPGPIRWLF
jgi:hypothetical protein